jgi:hypothetical protein
MNPVPPGVFPTGSYPVDGYLDLFMVGVLVAFAVVLGIIVWSVLYWNEEPARFVCPVRLRRVRAVFRLDDDGRRIDVLRCSVFRRTPITCGKPCTRTASAG